MFLPSRAKVALLRLLGHEVAWSARIGASYLNVRRIRLGENAFIGRGNVFTGLEELVMGEGSRINAWNRFTQAPLWRGRLVLGDRASISLRHYFDVCDEVRIGHDTIVAGHRSTFFTHSKGLEAIDFTKPIEIGEWCYVGSNVCMVPGARVGARSFVGMGAVVVKDHSGEPLSLLAGNPARVVKRLPPDAPYFTQGPLVHPHLRGRAKGRRPA